MSALTGALLPGGVQEGHMRESSVIPDKRVPGVLRTEPTSVELVEHPRGRLPELEQCVLAAFAERGLLTPGQLRALTGCSLEELKPILHRMTRRGLLRRLNTVVESYCPASGSVIRADR